MSVSKDGPQTSKRPPLTVLQVLTIVGVVVWLLILLDFNHRLAAEQQLVNASNEARTEVASLDQEHTLLLTQVAYATTDAAVVDWAHASGKLAQPGEVLVVPIVPTAQPTPVSPPAPLPTPPPTWVLWQNLFVGVAPRVVP
jgi:hypothetical protein